MKLIDVIDDEESIEREANIGYIYCKKDNGSMLENTIIMKFVESFKKSLYSFSFNNQHTPIPNICVTGGLNVLVILVGKEHYSPKWYIKTIIYSKEWVKY